MNAVKMLGIALIAAAVLGLAYGGFRASDTREVQVGTIAMTVTDERTISIPMWAGVAAIVLGGTLLLVPTRKA